MKAAKFSYDPELDSLVVYREDRKTIASIKAGEIVVDLDSSYNISAVEIMNPDILYKIPKSSFAGIASASIQVLQRANMAWIYVILKLENSQQKVLPLPLQLERPIYA